MHFVFLFFQRPFFLDKNQFVIKVLVLRTIVCVFKAGSDTNIMHACPQPCAQDMNVEWKIYSEQLHAKSIEKLFGFNQRNWNQWKIKERQIPIKTVPLSDWRKKSADIRYPQHQVKSFITYICRFAKNCKKNFDRFRIITYICKTLIQNPFPCSFFFDFSIPFDFGLDFRQT